MLAGLLLVVLDAVLGFFCAALLGRFYMQWVRVSFRNPIGQFVVAITDWIVVPLRRVLPGLFGLDLASLASAWAAQVLLVSLGLWLRGRGMPEGATALGLTVLAAAAFETARIFIYLLIAVVIFAAVLSWVNPHAPVAPLFHALSRPFLEPLQRILPPIANIDLSPLVALLAFQVLLTLLGYLRSAVFAAAGA
ncbi:MAG: YggT family protein [Rhodocyclaceae bacterium]